MNSDLSSRRVRTDAYDLGEVVPVEGFASIDPGTNVLISGGQMLGKERLALELLAAGSEEEAIAVTPDTAGGRLRDSFESVAGGLDRLRVVDCTGASSKGSFDDTDDMKYVGSPGDPLLDAPVQSTTRGRSSPPATDSKLSRRRPPAVSGVTAMASSSSEPAASSSSASRSFPSIRPPETSTLVPGSTEVNPSTGTTSPRS